jgi:GDPmannose 4,6-dehydratase
MTTKKVNMKKAIITGITGQDGGYLAKLLLSKNYKVYGLMKRYTAPNWENLDFLGIKDQIEFINGDLTDIGSLMPHVRNIQPDEFYNLGAQSFVGESWNQAHLTTEVNAIGVLNCLTAIKEFSPTTRFYQASTSEMFGNSNSQGIQTEETPFIPRSPYGVAKLYAHHITQNYRESYGMFACSGILFNHESPIRGIEFVTRKITDGVAQIVTGKKTELILGNLDAKRDWGFAGDFVEAMWLMLQQEQPEDYIISTGNQHTVRDVLDIAFNRAGISDWSSYVRSDQQYMRPAELNALLGSSDKAKHQLGWVSTMSFKELIETMTDEDLRRHAL